MSDKNIAVKSEKLNTVKVPNNDTAGIYLTHKETALMLETLSQVGFRFDSLETANSLKSKLIAAAESFNE